MAVSSSREPEDLLHRSVPRVPDTARSSAANPKQAHKYDRVCYIDRVSHVEDAVVQASVSAEVYAIHPSTSSPNG